jgi:hypothetical protein
VSRWHKSHEIKASCAIRSYRRDVFLSLKENKKYDQDQISTVEVLYWAIIATGTDPRPANCAKRAKWHSPQDRPLISPDWRLAPCGAKGVFCTLNSSCGCIIWHAFNTHTVSGVIHLHSQAGVSVASRPSRAGGRPTTDDFNVAIGYRVVAPDRWNDCL